MKALRVLEALLHSPARSFGSGELILMLFFMELILWTVDRRNRACGTSRLVRLRVWLWE